jgi:glutamate decarboxylase
MITEVEQLDNNPRLNTSSCVNVVSEPEEREVAVLGMQVNMADQTVYPASFKMHNDTLNMVANLWTCPQGNDFDETGVFPGAGAVWSTAACLLAGLALKMRWRSWHAKRNPSLSSSAVRGTYPLIISSILQAAWEKFLKYFDVEPRFFVPRLLQGTTTGEGLAAFCNDKTIGVVCILGNH